MEQFKIPIGRGIEAVINFFVDHFSFATKAFAGVTENGINLLVSAMMFFPPWALILIFTAISWLLTRNRGITIGPDLEHGALGAHGEHHHPGAHRHA
jgi:glycine betaine/proline transport system permease protein